MIYTKLPWEQLERQEDKDKCEVFCKALAKKESLLILLEAQHEYKFDFDLDKYAFLSVVMAKLCRNLNDARLRLVPDEVSDTEFWRNYFYQIELWKQKQGLPSKLGDIIAA